MGLRRGEPVLNLTLRDGLRGLRLLAEGGAQVSAPRARWVIMQPRRAQSHIGRFTLVREIGRGGSGTVYEALDAETGRRLALKVLRAFEHPEVLVRFKREFRLVKLLAHRNIVALEELFSEDDDWFFTMELVQGVDFLSFVRRGRSVVDRPENTRGGRVLRDEAARWARAARLGARGDARGGHRPQGREAVERTRDAGGAARRPRFRRRRRPSSSRTRADLQRGRDAGVHGAGARARRGIERGRRHVRGGGHAVRGAHRPPSRRGIGHGDPLEEDLRRPRTRRASSSGPRPRILSQLATELLDPNPEGRPTASGALQRLGLMAMNTTGEIRATSGAKRRRLFVGRQSELVALEAAFADANAGGAATVVLRGESGIGKTALVNHFLAQVEDRTLDAVILNGRCRENEWIPFKAFDGIMDDLARVLTTRPQEARAILPRRADRLAQVFSSFRSFVTAPVRGAQSGATDPIEQRSQLLTSVRELFERLCEHSSVVVVIDDVQWADADSLALLNELTRPPDAPPLTLLVTLRSDVVNEPLKEPAFARAQVLDSGPSVDRGVGGARS